MRTSDLLAGAALVLVVGGLAVMPDPPPTESASPAAATAPNPPVDRAELVCPRMPGQDADTATAVAAVPVADLDLRDLENQPVPLLRGESELGEITKRGQVWRSRADGLAAGLLARADGALAAGLTGTTAGTMTTERRRGLAAIPCSTPAPEWWFVGVGSTAGRTGNLVLTNPSSGAAVVDLTFFGPKGELEDVEGNQIGLQPGEQRVLPMNDFVPGVSNVALQVRTRQGHVTAELSDTYVEGLQAAGVDYLAAAAAPARQAVVTGISNGPGGRALSVVNTGSSETVVDVEVMGGSGAFAPTDFDVLQVPAHSVVLRDVSDITGDQVSGLRLTADQPISASVRARAGDPVDVSYSAAAEPLTTGAAVALPEGRRPTLVLSATGTSAVTADIRVYDSAGKTIGERKRLQLSGGQTDTWSVPDRGDPAAVVVTSAQGAQLVGAVRWTGDDGASTTALAPLRTVLDQPPLVYDPAGP
ncbi:MAG: DUF5719 family protein [Nocardioidaceae bacterium]